MAKPVTISDPQRSRAHRDVNVGLLRCSLVASAPKRSPANRCTRRSLDGDSRRNRRREKLDCSSLVQKAALLGHLIAAPKVRRRGKMIEINDKKHTRNELIQFRPSRNRTRYPMHKQRSYDLFSPLSRVAKKSTDRFISDRKCVNDFQFYFIFFSVRARGDNISSPFQRFHEQPSRRIG